MEVARLCVFGSGRSKISKQQQQQQLKSVKFLSAADATETDSVGSSAGGANKVRFRNAIARVSCQDNIRNPTIGSQN